MKPTNNLTIEVRSFSYRRGLPYDATGHGGGYIFDCRAILNPGRYERYMMLSGRDQEVIDFFRENTDIASFLEHACQLVEMSIQNYQEREFDHLMVAFGCTGGRHRSVYCAEQMAQWLKDTFNLGVDLEHLDLNA